ncbi:hypothetical protein U6A24_02110 [Aquimarina gracilis]|uniref:Uncharacterized protein n=1 Tax=Aquimarina gracilis TaxID=874422 RepID=A0ABU5ZQ83_9FLAO|nr:hypothetical protein [Aquimarina gracilis]MEB3344232.1 hypothetical protein [Aquimarina gracilis]
MMVKVKLFLLTLSTVTLICCKGVEPTDQKIEAAFSKINNEKLWDELRKMEIDDQLYRTPLDSIYRVGKKKPENWDSLWQLQEKIDNKNTERLIEITEKYGFPSPHRIDQPIAAWMIFQHSAKKYHKKLKPLLERECEAARIGDVEYEMIKWHLEGRKGFPFEITYPK